MTRRSGRVRAGMGGLVLLALSACAGLHPPEPPTQVATAAPEPPADTPTPSSEGPADGSGVTAPAVDSSPPPACACADQKPKPKPRPRPRPVHKEAPPQLPTAPAVAETPKGGLVDAQVHSMAVSVMSILGKRVRGANGEDLGRVVDVLADASGRVRVAIVDFGGFLGVGNHRIAVDWPLLRFDPDAHEPSLLLSVSKEKLQEAPEYKDNPRPQTLMEPAVPAAAATPPVATPAAAPATAPPPPAPPSSDSKK